MIIEVSGDILLTKAKSIAHSVAPLDHFESGLALGLREKYPEMVKDFRHEVIEEAQKRTTFKYKIKRFFSNFKNTLKKY